MKSACWKVPIEPIKLVRQDLSGANLTELDLTLVTLKGVRLEHTPNRLREFPEREAEYGEFALLGA